MEVILLRPAGPSERTRDKFIACWQCQMVEMGIPFAFDDGERLPDALPDALDGVKLILIDEGSWEAYHAGPDGARLREFASNSGGILFKIDVPSTWSVADESAVRNALELVAASAGLTLNDPGMRHRLLSRTFRHLYETRRQHFLGQIENTYAKPFGSAFSETLAFHVLQTMELLHDYDPDFGWDTRLTRLLNYLMVERDEPVVDLDRIVGMETFIRQALRRGNSTWLEFARRRLDVVVNEFDRVEGVPVLMPGRDKLIWTEVGAMLAPSLALLSAATRQQSYLELAVKLAHAVRRFCYDCERRLYYHAGRPGYHTPAFWARGQAWAVIGLTGILRNLHPDHPDRNTIAHYLTDTAEGLLATQDPEGLWHNVMDEADSRSCVRAACIITYAYAEARRCGWVPVDSRIDRMLHRSWRAIRGRVFGNYVASSCWATGAGCTRQFYLSRPHVFYSVNDVLHCGAAYVAAFGDDQPVE